MNDKIFQSYRQYDSLTGSWWPHVEVDSLIYEGYCLPSEVPYERMFGIQISFESKSPKNDYRMWEISKSNGVGRFLWFDDLEEQNYEIILNWALKAGYARPYVYWEGNRSDDGEDLTNGTAHFCVKSTPKLLDEFGDNSCGESLMRNVDFIVCAYAKIVKDFDGVFFLGGRGFVFRDRFNQWVAIQKFKTT